MNHAVIVMIALVFASIINLIDVRALILHHLYILAVIRGITGFVCGLVAIVYYSTLSGLMDPASSEATTDLMFAVLSLLLTANVIARWGWKRRK